MYSDELYPAPLPGFGKYLSTDFNKPEPTANAHIKRQSCMGRNGIFDVFGLERKNGLSYHINHTSLALACFALKQLYLA
jgi:hypothetical protein